MMLSIFIFMLLVVGLLTLNLWIYAAAGAQAEARSRADLVARLVSDWIHQAAPPSGAWSHKERKALSEKLEASTLISHWTLAHRKDDRLQVFLSSEPQPKAELLLKDETDRFTEAMGELKFDSAEPHRIYVPVSVPGADPLAARLDLSVSAVPAYDIADATRGILTIMAIGTVLLMLNTYVFINRLVLRPLGALSEASNRVARGDFSKKIPEPETYDEMGRTIQAFNLMIEKVGEHHRTLITETERKIFAAQRLSTTGTLAAGIAHEINNPLAGMINAARSLREGRLDEAKRAEYLELILDGLERVRTIVQKILHFRPRPFQPQPVRLDEVAERAVAFLHHRTRTKKVELRNELPSDLPPVSGDPLDLQQAFLNILMNAVDACVMDEGVVTIAREPDEDAVRITIADNGCGMNREELERCRDPFFTTKDVGEGTGLGLSVANSIAVNHGGRLDLDSNQGQGTTVTLTFPLPRATDALRTTTRRKQL